MTSLPKFHWTLAMLSAAALGWAVAIESPVDAAILGGAWGMNVAFAMALTKWTAK